jgi:hypothetical protein
MDQSGRPDKKTDQLRRFPADLPIAPTTKHLIITELTPRDRINTGGIICRRDKIWNGY